MDLTRLAELKLEWHRKLWGEPLSALPPGRRRLLHTARLVYAVGRDLAEGQLTLRAMSLVYTTLLSLVPLLALSFSVLKGFGVHNQIQPTLLALFAPLGEKGVEITHQIIGFVDNIKVGVLGTLGLALLIYTVTTLLQKIEQDLNYVWRIKRGRPLAQRFSQYLSVLTVGPVLVFSALGITATLLSAAVVQQLMAIEPFGTLIGWAGQLVPYLLVIAAFAFVYVLMPNTRVRLGSALIGATAAGILWQSLGWAFATFIATSAKYTAIYAGFAIVVVTMIWLYLNWLIILIGASVAFYHQHPAQLATSRREPQLSNRAKEKLALMAMTLIGRQFHGSGPAWTLDGLADRLGVPVNALEPLVETLRRRGFLIETGDDPIGLVPAHALEHITIKALLDAVRFAEETRDIATGTLPSDAQVDGVISDIDAAIEDRLGARNLRDLVQPAAAAAPQPENSEPDPV